MSWANASYADALRDAIGEDFLSGRNVIRHARRDFDLPRHAFDALRRYSASEFAGSEDGKVLNRSLLESSDQHRQWAEDLDDAFGWSFDRDIVLWRGGGLATDESPCFISATLVERKARAFGNRHGGRLSAIIVKAGDPVAIPSFVWSQNDNKRTLEVVGREVEVILPRGTRMLGATRIVPFAKHPNIGFTLYEARRPDFSRKPTQARSMTA